MRRTSARPAAMMASLMFSPVAVSRPKMSVPRSTVVELASLMKHTSLPTSLRRKNSRASNAYGFSNKQTNKLYTINKHNNNSMIRAARYLIVLVDPVGAVRVGASGQTRSVYVRQHELLLERLAIFARQRSYDHTIARGYLYIYI